MQEESVHNLETLVQMLREEPEVPWDIVQDLLAETPGWLMIVQRLRGQEGSGNNFARADLSVLHSNLLASEEYYLVSPENRERLLTFFVPYTVLLDRTQTPGERAQRLQEVTGGGARDFCRACLDNADPSIAEPAQEVLAACDAQASLLRGSSARESSPDALLRLPQDAPLVKDPTLLRSAEAPPSTPTPEPEGWLARLFRRRKADR